MGQYIISDRRVDIFPDKAITIVDKLPLGNYKLCYNELAHQFYLEKIDLSLKTTIAYGQHVANRTRILNTFNKRQKNMGILLSGLKGTGKTFLVRDLSIELKKQNISSIIIDKRYDTSLMSEFLSRITESVFIIFDEFDKNYANPTDFNSDEDEATKDQNGLLTLLDGLFTNKMLFAFCCNNVQKINDYFIHRPSRIYYHIHFDELNSDVIKDYCNDKLNDKSFINDIILLRTTIRNFSFDVLKAIVEECNHYNESPLKAINYLNIKIDQSCSYHLKMIDMLVNEEIPFKNAYDDHYNFNLLEYLSGESTPSMILDSERIIYDYERLVDIHNKSLPKDKHYNVEDNEPIYTRIKFGDIQGVTSNNEIVFINEKIGVKFVLSRMIESSNVDIEKIDAALSKGVL